MNYSDLNPGDLVVERNHDTGHTDVRHVIATNAKATLGCLVMDNCVVMFTPDPPAEAEYDRGREAGKEI